jgi:hypothetical protein
MRLAVSRNCSPLASWDHCRNVQRGSCGRRAHVHLPFQLKFRCAGLRSDCVWRIQEGIVLQSLLDVEVYDLASMRAISWPSIAHSMSWKLKTRHCLSARSAFKTFFAYAPAVQAETTSKAKAFALA